MRFPSVVCSEDADPVIASGRCGTGECAGTGGLGELTLFSSPRRFDRFVDATVQKGAIQKGNLVRLIEARNEVRQIVWNQHGSIPIFMQQ